MEKEREKALEIYNKYKNQSNRLIESNDAVPTQKNICIDLAIKEVDLILNTISNFLYDGNYYNDFITSKKQSVNDVNPQLFWFNVKLELINLNP